MLVIYSLTERTEPHHSADSSHPPLASLSPRTCHPELQTPVPTTAPQGPQWVGSRRRPQGVAAWLHWREGGREEEEGAETSGPSREGGWRRQLLPPRLSLSAGFTWIGRFICNRAQGDSVRAGLGMGDRYTYPQKCTGVHRYMGTRPYPLTHISKHPRSCKPACLL